MGKYMEYFNEESKQEQTKAIYDWRCPTDKIYGTYSTTNILVNKQTAKDIQDTSLVSLIKQVEQLSADYRLIRTKEKMRLKIMEELGEYAVATLGDKAVTESPREELVDVIITSLSLYFLEGGTSQHLEEYGHKKLAKALKKLESQ